MNVRVHVKEHISQTKQCLKAHHIPATSRIWFKIWSNLKDIQQKIRCKHYFTVLSLKKTVYNIFKASENNRVYFHQSVDLLGIILWIIFDGQCH